MTANRKGLAWLEQGYILFAAEGIDGIQIERLARILQLNKSGFYYYFGDLEGYYAELLKLHEEKAACFVREVGCLKQFNPDFIHLSIAYASAIMFQVQLTRHRNLSLFNEVRKQIDRDVANAVLVLWSDFLAIQNNNPLALKYLHTIRDMFFNRVGLKDFNYEYLNELAEESKLLFAEIQQSEQVTIKGAVRV
jgi:AcrR family transcriptional regulator